MRLLIDLDRIDAAIATGVFELVDRPLEGAIQRVDAARGGPPRRPDTR